MKRTSFGIIATAIICTSAAGISISSCDNNNIPTTPGKNGGVDRSKGPQILGKGFAELIAIDVIPSDGATLEYDEQGNLVASDLNEEAGSGINMVFDSPITNWLSSLGAEFNGSQGALALEARDDLGKMQSRIDLRTLGDVAIATPTFTGHQDGEDPLYDVYILNNGSKVGSQLKVPAALPVAILPSAECPLDLASVSWSVMQPTAQAVWNVTLNPCCQYRFRLPDGRTLQGNAIRFQERITKGVYVYEVTSSIFATGSAVRLTTKAAMAYSYVLR